MKWIGRRQSDNVEDQRTSGTGQKIAIGGGFLGVVILLLNVFGGETGQAVGGLLQQVQGNQTEQVQDGAPLSENDKKMGEFVKVILADNEDVWNKVFQENGLQYEEPKLVLFRGSVNTACGGASASTGPFYCPGDRKVYLDLGFFDELKSRFGAEGGDFAIAYVISHEIGHHVQNLLGTSDKMRQAQQGKSEAEANKLSVVWTNKSQQKNNMLDEGDIEEALSAANAVGDDAIQSRMQGQVVPDSFTHGSSKQRMYWFNKGFTTGDTSQGNTFAE
jgi:uncharacterized protein